MHLTAQVGALTPLLKRALACTKETTPHAVLRHILVQADERGLTLRGTDLDVTTEIRAEGVVGELNTLVPPSLVKLLESLKKDAEVTLTQNGVVLRVRCGEFKARITCLEPREFPERPGVGSGEIIALPFGVLKRMVAAVEFCASKKYALDYTTTLLFKRTNGVAELVGSNGSRIGTISVPCDGPDAEVILPLRLATEAVAVDAPDDASVALGFSDRHVLCGVGNAVTIWCIKNDIAWPSISRVMTTKATRCVVDRAALAEASKRIGSVFVVEHKGETGKSYTRAMTLEFTQDGLALSSDETEFGSASETIPADREGPSGSGHVPALQIHAACEAIESERVIVSTDGRMVTVQPETLVEGVRGQMLVSACLK